MTSKTKSSKTTSKLNQSLRKNKRANIKRQNTKNTDASRATVTMNGNDTKFAAGLSFKKLFFIFLIGSVFGTIYEDILIYLQTYFATGTGVWMLHRGVIYGPFNVIYGFGAAAMCWFLLRKKYTNWQIFIYSALLGGVVEFMLSFLQETFTGTTSWDYSGQLLDIYGRTTIPIMAFWGVLGLLLVKFIYPACSDLIERIPPRVGNPLFWSLLVFMIFNCLISWSAIIRQNLRHHNIPPVTPIGEFYDRYYHDEYLRKYFPNMVRSEDK